MATTSMTFKIEIPDQEWYRHSLRKEWNSFPLSHPIYGDGNSFPLFLKQEYNINIEDCEFYVIGNQVVTAEFQSEQDYILWQLHQ